MFIMAIYIFQIKFCVDKDLENQLLQLVDWSTELGLCHIWVIYYL